MYNYVLCTAICTPQCQNGGDCTLNHTCSCTAVWTGQSCEEGMIVCFLNLNQCFVLYCKEIHQCLIAMYNYVYNNYYTTSSFARSARFATCARSSLRFNYFVLWSSASLHAPTQHIYIVQTCE